MKNQGQRQAEPEVTLDGIDASLRDLVKAADATDLTKALGGVAVENGGHTDERGSTSGGYPETGDVGSLDSMMIGKMQQALIGAGFDAGAIAAFMRGKQGDEEETEDPDEDEEGTQEPPMAGKFGKPASTEGGVKPNPRVKPSGGKGGGKMGKSLDSLRAHQNERGERTIADAMDVSPFLADFVTATSAQLDDMRKSIEEGRDTNADVQRKMAAAVYGIGQLVKGIAAHGERLDRRLGLVERAPNQPKGHQQLQGARPLEKGMPREVGGPSGQPEALTKGQVLSVLSYMNLEKGQRDERFRTIGGQPTFEIAAIYEGGGNLPRHALQAVHHFLATHPHEAPVALSYR